MCGALRLEKLLGGKEKFTRGEEKQHGNCSSCCCSCFFFQKPDCNYRQRFFTQRGGKSLHVRLPKCFSGKTTVVIEIKPKCHFASFFRLLKQYFSAGKCLECQSRFILFFLFHTFPLFSSQQRRSKLFQNEKNALKKRKEANKNFFLFTGTREIFSRL